MLALERSVLQTSPARHRDLDSRTRAVCPDESDPRRQLPCERDRAVQFG